MLRVIAVAIIIIILTIGCGSTSPREADPQKEVINIFYYVTSDGIVNIIVPLNVDPTTVNGRLVKTIKKIVGTSGQVYTHIETYEPMDLDKTVCPVFNNYNIKEICRYKLG